MITRSLCPRISWACCASCTLMVLSSLKIEPLGREHSNITSWSENTFRPNSQSTPKKLSFWDLCRANGEFLYPAILNSTHDPRCTTHVAPLPRQSSEQLTGRRTGLLSSCL